MAPPPAVAFLARVAEEEKLRRPEESRVHRDAGDRTCFSAGIPGTDVYGKQTMLLMKHYMVPAPDSTRRDSKGRGLPRSSASTCSGTDESYSEPREDVEARRPAGTWMAMAAADVDSRMTKARLEKRALSASAAEFVPRKPIVRAELSLHVQMTPDYVPRIPYAPPGVHLFSSPQALSAPTRSPAKPAKAAKAKAKAAKPVSTTSLGPVPLSAAAPPPLLPAHAPQSSKTLLPAVSRAPLREHPPSKPRPPADPPKLPAAAHEGPPAECVAATVAGCVAAALALAFAQRRYGLH